MTRGGRLGLPRVKFRADSMLLDAWSIVLCEAAADADKHRQSAEDGEAYPGEKKVIPADHVGEIAEHGGSGGRRHIAEEIEEARGA